MSSTNALGTVYPILPLSLLEAVRAHDRPAEILEDEDLTVSLPRRLGLTGVVDTQIRQFEQAERSGRSIQLEEVQNLIRLVLKRPDAEAILRDTGHRVALHHFRRVPEAYVKILRKLPRGLLTGAYRRSARRMLKHIVGNATIEIGERPPVVRLRNNAIASLEPSGTSCAMFTAAIGHLAELYAGGTSSATQTTCSSSVCEWKVVGV